MLYLSFFLYKSEEDAETSSRIGGTAFSVIVPLDPPHEDYAVTYVITARHLIDSGCTFARIDHRDGAFRVIETNGWHHAQPDDRGLSADVSVALFRPTRLLFLTSMFAGVGVTRKDLMELDIGTGCETYMIGRLMGFEGKEENSQCVRFGHVSMMPRDPVFNKDLGCDVETILVEMRSIGGHSGSPVFVKGTNPKGGGEAHRVLGIVWGHVGDQISENAGIAAVTPFWRVHDLLFSDERVIAERQAIARTIPAEDPPLVAPDGSWTRWQTT